MLLHIHCRRFANLWEGKPLPVRDLPQVHWTQMGDCPVIPSHAPLKLILYAVQGWHSGFLCAGHCSELIFSNHLKLETTNMTAQNSRSADTMYEIEIS